MHSVEDALRPLRAFIERIARGGGAAVPLRLEPAGQGNEVAAPGQFRREGPDVLPVRPSLAVVQDAVAVTTDEDGVIPGPDGLTDPARHGQLRGVALPLVRAAGHRIFVCLRSYPFARRSVRGG